MNRILISIAAATAALSIGACSDMTHREKSTVAGAAIGGVARTAMQRGSRSAARS